MTSNESRAHLFAINNAVGLCFGAALFGGAIYVAADSLATARKDFHRSAERYLHKKIKESQDSMPPGLNGQYPADGPLADYYRNNPDVGVEVAPQ